MLRQQLYADRSPMSSRYEKRSPLQRDCMRRHLVALMVHGHEEFNPGNLCIELACLTSLHSTCKLHACSRPDEPVVLAFECILRQCTDMTQLRGLGPPGSCCCTTLKRACHVQVHLSTVPRGHVDGRVDTLYSRGPDPLHLFTGSLHHQRIRYLSGLS